MDEKKFKKSFEELKEYLSSPKILSRLVLGEDLFTYLAAPIQAVSVVLVWEEEGI